MRLALGIAGEDDETTEAEAGAYLEAETAHEIGNIAEMMRSYIDAMNGAGSG